MVQLTEQELENLRSQFATLRLDKQHGGRRYLPFVFTEQGISMLSALLRSQTAIEISIKIIDFCKYEKIYSFKLKYVCKI